MENHLTDYWKHQIHLSDLLAARFNTPEGQDPESNLNPHVVRWITHRPLFSYWLENVFVFLMAIGVVVIVLGAIAIIKQVMILNGSFSDLSRTDLANAFSLILLGAICTLPIILAHFREHELSDREILNQMPSEEARTDMRVLLQLRNDFRDGKLMMIAFTNPSHILKFTDADFERRNCLNLLLPKLGRKKLVSRRYWTHRAKIVVFDLELRLTDELSALAAMSPKERLAALYKTNNDHVFSEIKAATLQVHGDPDTRQLFAILEESRSLRMSKRSDNLKLKLNDMDIEVAKKFKWSKSKVDSIRRGGHKGLREAIVVPGYIPALSEEQ